MHLPPLLQYLLTLSAPPQHLPILSLPLLLLLTLSVPHLIQDLLLLLLDTLPGLPTPVLLLHHTVEPHPLKSLPSPANLIIKEVLLLFPHHLLLLPLQLLSLLPKPKLIPLMMKSLKNTTRQMLVKVPDLTEDRLPVLLL